MNERNTKGLIKKAFLEIYSKKGIENISVKELCSSVPIARTTFYLHYRNVDEIKSEIENNLIQGLFDISAGITQNLFDQSEIVELFEKVSDFIVENREEFYAFLIKQPNIRFLTAWKELIKSHTPLIFKQDVVAQELVSEVIAGAIIAGQICILKNIDSINNQEIRSLAVSALSNSVDFIKSMNTSSECVV